MNLLDGRHLCSAVRHLMTEGEPQRTNPLLCAFPAIRRYGQAAEHAGAIKLSGMTNKFRAILQMVQSILSLVKFGDALDPHMLAGLKTILKKLRISH